MADILQHSILKEAAEEVPLPKRFVAHTSKAYPQVTILDTKTLKVTVIPLYAYRAVREVLNDLFNN